MGSARVEGQGMTTIPIQKTTVEQFEAFIALPENAERRFELIHGEIVEKMPTIPHGRIAARLTMHLGIYLEGKRIGFVVTEGRFRPEHDVENDRIPDVAVIAEGMPEPEEGPALYMPMLAVEVKSPRNTMRKLREKAYFYLANGCQMVWLVNPEKNVVEVLTADDETLYLEEDILTAEALFPGFSLPVRQIFAP
jgi:Uma2 family endonuclease